MLAVAAIGAGAFLARRHVLMCLLAVAFVVAAAGPAQAKQDPSPWGPSMNAEDVPGTSQDLNVQDFQDGCPIESPDGRNLYFASTRPGGQGGIDIWVAHRESNGAPWGAPENLPAPVNSTSDDFCPTPTRGGSLFFVSRRTIPGACGMGDIYLTRLNPATGWQDPQHLGCDFEGGPNTGLDEQGPSYVKAGGPSLYYSSGPDIYVSERHGDGTFGLGRPVGELNSAATDIQPNVLRGGREIVFASNRGGPTAFGGQDIWTSTRKGVNDAWSAPVNLGANVNTMAGETRPSFSWDGDTLYFGRAPGLPSTSDIFVADR